jgi:hypothetical protein
MTSAPENQPVGSASRRAGAWGGGMGADGFQPHGAAQNPAHASRWAWPTDSDPASSTGVTQPMLSEASNNARTYRPRRRGMRI